MPDEQKTNLRLEIAHVLFIDIVGYSKLLIEDELRSSHYLIWQSARPGKPLFNT